MDITYLIPLLFLMTLSAVMIFAVVSKHRTDKKLHDDNAKKSTLAADADNH